MVKYTWVKESVPKNLEIKQVYGIAFSKDGEILLRKEQNEFKLTGGKPERKDKSLIDTLKREYQEELNTELKEIYFLGYLLVKEENKPPYAQVRMIAKIKRINEERPDSDNGKMYERVLIPVNRAKDILNYPDEAGNKMLEEAITLAKKRYNLPNI